MPLVCPKCGAYALQNVSHGTDSMTCSECSSITPANIFPLFIITGTSGAGKTSVIPELRKQLPECVIFDKDLLWGRCEQFYNSWLLIAFSIAQSGRHTVICGTIMPWDLEACEERHLVGTIHFLSLHCNDEAREQRLRARPAWRQSSSDEFISAHQQFAQWLLDNASTKYDPPMQTIDTSNNSVEEVAQAIAQWVMTVLEGKPTKEPSSLS